MYVRGVCCVQGRIILDQIFRIPPIAYPLHLEKMAKLSMDSVTENELMKRYEELVNKDTWNDVCRRCRLPALLHNGVCTRQNEVEASEYEKILDERDKFCERMEG